jgi:DNA-binding Lrp family transcriptional regulator
MVKLDVIDKQLLNMLQANSKVSISEISNILNLSKSPIYDRIKRYEKEGFIKKYVAVLDSKKVTNNMVVFCSVSLENQRLDALEAFGSAIQDLPEVVESYLMGGANDFLLKVIVNDLDAYHKFSSGVLAALPNVNQIKSTFVLNEIKSSTSIPLY